MNARAVLGRMKPGEWMVGGERDFAGEKAYGFGPQTAAQVASFAYVMALDENPGASRDQFVRALCAAFEEGMRETLAEPERAR